MKRTAVAGIVFAACVAATVARSEMSPRAYESMRKKAPELVQVFVLTVDTDIKKFPSYEFPGATETDTNVAATAEVISVIRSKANLQPGVSIRITYTSQERLVPGARPIPVLKKGEKVLAYLKGGPDAFQPAALGASFER